MRAFAKVNLSLNIVGKRPDGKMHDLDSVMMSVDVFDIVTIAERDDDNIVVRFINAPNIGDDNTAFRAAKSVQQQIGCRGFDIEIEKGIPVGAGLGGSSADGAAVLRALDVLYNLPVRGADMRALALSVGSDVPFMLTGGLARVRGAGENLFFIDNKLKLFAVGLMRGSVSTTAAYKKFDELNPSYGLCPTNNDILCDLLLSGSADALMHFDNALYSPAAHFVSDIAADAELLRSLGATVNLTGSGGMIVGYFTDLDKFLACTQSLKHRADMRVFAPIRTGLLHERLS